MTVHRDEAEYFRSVLDNLSGGFLSVDTAGVVVYGNPTAGRILHVPMGAAVGKPYEESLAAYPEVVAVIRDALQHQRLVHRGEVTVMHADARMTIGYSTLAVRSRAGELLGVGIIFQDLTMALARKGANK